MLQVENLRIEFGPPKVVAVGGISFELNGGETLGIVGESGSGKSLTLLSLLGLQPATATLSADRLQFLPTSGPAHSLTQQPEAVRGRHIGLIFQEPDASLNPVLSVGRQLAEVLQVHGHPKKSLRAECLKLLRRVRLQDAERIYESYPHQLSGGQKQRIMIAMALAPRPAVLLADEPTTALDPAVQTEILDLLNELKKDYGLSIIFVSHDLSVVRRVAERVLVMYRGEIVERGGVAEVFERPRHAYTRALLSKQLNKTLPTDSEEILIEVKDLTKYYEKSGFWGRKRRRVPIFDYFDLTIRRGEWLGLVGASGSGKTTLGRCMLGLEPFQSGTVLFGGRDIRKIPPGEFRRRAQIIFQNPYATLNPSMSVGEMLGEVVRFHHPEKDVRHRTTELLQLVRLPEAYSDRFPHQLSGGERQRVSIARALAVEPEFIVCDEIVSALDVSVQRSILELLGELRSRLGLTYLFISHDAAVVERVCERVVVLEENVLVKTAVRDD